jgi:hypothetical protein
VRISSIGYITINLSARIPFLVSIRPFTHRRVKVDKDGARDVFAIADFGENCLVRAVLVGCGVYIGIYMAIGLEAVFE